MREIPITVLLSFPAANYKHPNTRGPALTIVNSIFITLVVLIVLLRLYTRLFIKRWIGIDDVFIIIATVFTIGLTVAIILANVKYMWDRHIWDIPLDQISSLGKIAIAAKCLFTMATFFTRCSLLSFYYRLVHDSGLKKFKWALHAAGILNFAVGVAFLVLSVFQCWPISAYWKFSFVPLHQCLDEGKVTLAAGIINCFLDLLITALPIPMVMRLQMRRRQQLGVVFLLSLGFIVTIAGIVRTYYIYKSLVLSYDETWYAYPLWICAAVEVDLAVICACAPALRPFLVIYFRPLITSVTGTRRSNKYGSATNSKKAGYASAPSGDNSQLWSTVDDEKSGGAYISANQIPAPKRTISKPNPASSSPPERLTILRRQSFEVSHEDKRYLREEEQPIGMTITSTPHDDSPQTTNRWRPRDRPEFTPHPGLNPVSPLAANEAGFKEARLSPNPARGRSSTQGATPKYPDEDQSLYSFWQSETSEDGPRAVLPQIPAPVPPSLQGDGTRRWNIKRSLSEDYDAHHGIEMRGIPRTKSYSTTDRSKEGNEVKIPTR